jgi:hypothetical protein
MLLSWSDLPRIIGLSETPGELIGVKRDTLESRKTKTKTMPARLKMMPMPFALEVWHEIEKQSSLKHF